MVSFSTVPVLGITRVQAEPALVADRWPVCLTADIISWWRQQSVSVGASAHVDRTLPHCLRKWRAEKIDKLQRILNFEVRVILANANLTTCPISVSSFAG